MLHPVSRVAAISGILLSLILAVHATGEPAYGPEIFTGPDDVSAVLRTPDSDEPIYLLVENGDAGGLNRVSEARITINGLDVFVPGEINANTRYTRQLISEALDPAVNAFNLISVDFGDGEAGIMYLTVGTSMDLAMPPPAPSVSADTTSTSSSQAVLTVLAPEADRVEISGPDTSLIGNPLSVIVENGLAVATVPLKPNFDNQFSVRSIGFNGLRSAASGIEITNDSQPPSIWIDFPAPGAEITAATTDIAGRVSDRLSGFMGLTVMVNGVPAEVDAGIGTNGTFFLPAFPLGDTSGPVTITATAQDAIGNVADPVHLVVVRRIADAQRSSMAAVAGNDQAAPIHTTLDQPITVRLTQPNGQPLADKLVTFTVERSDGRLSAAPGALGSMIYQTRSNAAGEAQAFWRLGTDAGCGNNRVRVTSTSVEGTVVFCASALPGPPKQISIGSGNGQRGETGSPLLMPMVVYVHDGCNGVSEMPVVFEAVTPGTLINGQSSFTVVTSATGHAEAFMTLSGGAGVNRVRASFPGNPTEPAEFVAYGTERDEEGVTTLTGLVQDNAGHPIANVEAWVTIDNEIVGSDVTNDDGQFFIDAIPGSGPAEVYVDGADAVVRSRQAQPRSGNASGRPTSAALGVPDEMSVEPVRMFGRFPALHVPTVLVEGAGNLLSRPIRLPELDATNEVVYNGNDTVTLECAGIEGLTMTIQPGTTITLPDGTRVGPGNPGQVCLSLNQVHHDDVPMPMPDGAAPQFAWTFQPGGATFDKPVSVTYPNMSGLAPGSIAYFLSWDDATAQFDIVSTGTVSPDGSTIVSDPGSGITLSGWGCNCPPYSVTGECEECDERCMDGSLMGGEVTVSSSEIMVGDQVTFTIAEITDTGGTKMEVCEDGTTSSTDLPAGSVSISWQIMTPTGGMMTGSGRTASFTADECGSYQFSYTATASRSECAPSPKTGSSSARAVLDDWGITAAVGFEVPDPLVDRFNSLAGRIGIKVDGIEFSFSGRTRDCCDDSGSAVPDGESETAGAVTFKLASSRPVPVFGWGIYIEEEISVVFDSFVVKAGGGILFKSSISFAGEVGERESACVPEENCVFWSFGLNAPFTVEATVEAAFCDGDGRNCDGFDIDFLAATTTLSARITNDASSCADGTQFSAGFSKINLAFNIQLLGFTFSLSDEFNGVTLF